MTIKLTDIIKIYEPKKYKVHLANWNGDTHPLDVFVKDKNEWQLWNSWRSERDDFNRQYIFSLIKFYHESDIWLFGGIYEILERLDKPRSQSYIIKLTDQLKSHIGRLKIRWPRAGRQKSRVLEGCLGDFEVSEILKEEYTGAVFCGYENINHGFHILEPIFINQKPDWKASLENIKGVYLIMDKSNGKRYVGSAYGDSGIWSRWSSYMCNGHGHNDELTKLINEKGKEYARKNFLFVLLEHRPMKADDKTIIDRENYWKEALLSRGVFGYNKN